MMDETKLLTVERAQRSQSGKTLSVLSGDRWYTTKHFELGNMIGMAIHCQTSESDWQGKPMYWINDYTIPGNQPGTVQPPVPPIQAPPPIQTPVNMPQQAMMPPLPSTTAPQAINRDASIVAQTLCKTVTFTTIQDAWAAYKLIYAAYQGWLEGPDHQDEAEQTLQAQAQAPEFVDNIPF